MSDAGGYCWYCYWGWPKPVADIYDRAVADIDALGEDGKHDMNFGPAHIVWEDENWDSADWCLAQCDQPTYSDMLPESIAIIRRSLQELLALPEETRNPCPADYDGNTPQDYPPPPGTEMVRK